MMQTGQIETGVEASDINPGDVVRLLKPFRPDRYTFHEYTFAIVAGVVQGHQPGLDGLVVYLYEPDSSTTYVDQAGETALFSFDFDEVELAQVNSDTSF